MDKQVTYTDTKGFLALEKDSRSRNRGPNENLLSKIDPNGTHVVKYIFIHNDMEYRALWLVKLINDNNPAEVFMDNSFECFDKNTTNNYKSTLLDRAFSFRAVDETTY